jgi:hypothetical protein
MMDAKNALGVNNAHCDKGADQHLRLEFLNAAQIDDRKSNLELNDGDFIRSRKHLLHFGNESLIRFLSGHDCKKPVFAARVSKMVFYGVVLALAFG